MFLLIAGGVFYALYSAPTVSVVMPVYNRSDLVGRAIESILNQTFTDFEFIIVDDGSTDNTPDVVRSYAKKDKRIRFLSYGQNRGVGYARQYGLDAARGEFVAVMDSDDLSLPDRLAATVRFLRKNPEFVGVSGQVRIFTDNMPASDIKASVSHAPKIDSVTIKRSGHRYGLDLIFSNSFQNTTALFRRAFVQKNNIHYDLSLKNAEDYDFWASFVIKGGLLAELNETLGYIRIHKSYAPDYYNEMQENSKKVVRRLIARFYGPNEDEVAYGTLTLLEQCRILNRILKANVTRQIIPVSYMSEVYSERCPLQVDKAIFLYHPYWQRIFIYKTNTQGILWPYDNMEHFVKTDGYLQIKWDKWASEVFRLDYEKETGIFVPKEEQIQVVHPFWKDIMIYEDGKSRLCRFQTNDCAVVKTEANDRLVLIWENEKWGIEIFKKQEDVWRFVSKGKVLPLAHEQE